MPYADKEKQKEFQRNWDATIRKARRDAWLEENGPCVRCGSIENLEVDHIHREEKIDHRVWSWSNKRRTEELSKCQVLCSGCHDRKTVEDFGGLKHDASGYRRGCRCDLCRIAHVKCCNEWRWANGKRKKREP